MPPQHPPGTVLSWPDHPYWIVCENGTARIWTGAPIPEPACLNECAHYYTPIGRVPPHLLLSAQEWQDAFRLPTSYDPARHDLFWRGDEARWDWAYTGWFKTFAGKRRLDKFSGYVVSRAACDAPECAVWPQIAPGWVLEVPPDPPSESGPPTGPPELNPGGPEDLRLHWIFNPPAPRKENPMFLFRLLKFAPGPAAWLLIGWLAFGSGGETVKDYAVEWWTAPTPLHLGDWTRVTTCDACQNVVSGGAGMCPSCGGESFREEKAQELTESVWGHRVPRGWAFPDGSTRTSPGHWRLPERSVRVEVGK